MWFDREPDICQGGPPAQSGEAASKHDLFLEIFSGAAEETRNSSHAIQDDDGVKGSEETQSLTSMESEKQVPPQVVLHTSGPGKLEVAEGSRHVSISDEEKATADRVRVGHRTGRVQIRYLVCVLETKSVTGSTLEVRAASVREFFVWSGLSGNNSVQTLEVDRPRSSSTPFFPQNHRGWRNEEMLAKFFFPISQG